MVTKQTLEGYVAFQAFLQGYHEATDNPYPPKTLENRNWEFGWDTACGQDLIRRRSKGGPEAPEISGNCGC